MNPRDRNNRNALIAWWITLTLALAAIAGFIAAIWTGDPRFESTAWVVLTWTVVAMLAGAMYAGRNTPRQ